MLLFRKFVVEQFSPFFIKAKDFSDNAVKVDVLNQICGCESAGKEITDARGTTTVYNPIKNSFIAVSPPPPPQKKTKQNRIIRLQITLIIISSCS